MANTMSKYGSNTNRPLSEIVGLSTDTKPTDSIEGVQIQNGSTFRELDTGKKFLFDAENTTWNEVSSGGGGSTLIEKSISANGVYNASEDSADGYSKVTIDVSNTYTAQDEGKVVDNGALVAQTAMSSEVTENGTVDTTLYNSVTVNVPSGGGTSQPRKDVNFYDYDGTIVDSYTAAEFAELSAMPSNPSHDGLTAQGWNWSLSDAKTYVASYGELEIGQMYVTSDGKTRLYITLTEGRTSPVLQLYLNANSELDIDWGDGSAHSTFTSTSASYKSEKHNYASIGDYIIAITVTTGGFVLQSSSSSVSSILWNNNNTPNSPDRAYCNSINKIEIGTGITSIGDNAFLYCTAITSITMPSTIVQISQYAFSTCRSLTSLTIPSGVTNISKGVVQTCSSLTSLAIPSGVINISKMAFQNCYSLKAITIPSGVTNIGEYAFQSCYTLKAITIPSEVTTIGQYVFNDNISLRTISMSNEVSNIINSMCQGCSSLTKINISSGATLIGNSAFSTCYSLSSIIIPNLVRTIGVSAFSGCKYMSFIKFEPTTPPTVSSPNAWQDVSTSTKILVPTGTLETYKSASNYPNPSTYTYEEY